MKFLIHYSILCGCLFSQSTYLFNEFDIPLGGGKQYTILTGDVLDDTTIDVVTLNRLGNFKTHLQIFTFENDQWIKKMENQLNPYIRLVDIANIGGEDKLVYFNGRSLNYYDSDSNSERHLLDVNFHIQPDTNIAIPHRNIAQDLNGDGLSDFILPSVQGFWVYTQLPNGSFADGVKMGPPEPFRHERTFDDPRLYGDVGITALSLSWYLSRVRNFDANLDGRTDIIFWNTDHFDAYLQSENGQFSSHPTPFTTDVPFDSDGIYSIVFGYTESNPFSLITGLKRSTSQTVIHSIQDLNNDGFVDLVTHTLSGRSVLKQKSVYRIYWGEHSKDGIQFSLDSESTIFPKGRSGGAESGGYSHQYFEDFNGDNQTDILRYDVQMNLFAILKVFITKTVIIDIEAYGMDGDNYSEKPNFSHELKLEFDVSGTDGGFFPSFLMGDLNGDKKTDFILGARRDNLDIYWGANDGLINPIAETIHIENPHIENRIWASDFNHDGKDDILMYYEKLDEPRKMKVVMSQ